MSARALFVLLGSCLVAQVVEAQVKTETVHYYSEAVRCGAKLFTPANHSATANSAAVVVAPGERATRTSVEPIAQAIASRGVVVLAIDYRGWGECGGFLYFGEPVRWDDRLRFMQMTTTMNIRRGRLDPKAQVIDIRNALTFLQGVAGVDRARMGVWGADLSGGHAIVAAAADARVKAVVAQSPMLAGKDAPRIAFSPTREQQAAMIKLARSGAVPASDRAARTMNAEEASLALAEYKPYWSLEHIPATTAVAFVVEQKDLSVADAATKALKGPSSVVKLTGPAGQSSAATSAAADWFATKL